MAGSLNYSYPLSLPPGRNGLTPDLSLSYSSQPGANSNIVGYGWDFSIPVIARINRNGSDVMFSQFLFYSSLGGELGSSTPGTYGDISEKGSFLKYSFSTSTNAWIVTDKTGTTYKFGTSASSRQDNPLDSTQVYKWELDEVRDTNGNYIKFTYFKDAGQIYPSTILYTGNGVTDGPFEVDFLRESRSDIASSSLPGFQIVSKYRINEIDAKVSGTWVRKYALGYSAGDNQSRSLLSSITAQGQNDAGTVVTLPASTFTYQPSNPGWVATSSNWLSSTYFANYYNYAGDVGVRLADVNGDGLADVIQGLLDQPGTSSLLNTWINTGYGFTASSTWVPPTYLANYYNFNGSGDDGVHLVDVNGDGRPDIIQSVQTSVGSITTNAWINSGSGWVASSTWNPPVLLTDYTNSHFSGDVGWRIIDVNGDGLPDLVQSYRDPGTSFSKAYINNGNGWTLATSTIWQVPVPFVDYYSATSGDVGTRVADLNGDGLPDIIQAYINAVGTPAPTAIYLNNGHGWDPDPTWSFPTYFLNYYNVGGDVGTRLMDVNGDGLPDVVQGMYDHNHLVSMMHAWLNTGHGFVQNDSWAPPTTFVEWWGAQMYDDGVRSIDVDGNNVDDLIRSEIDPIGGDYKTAYANTSKKVDLLIRATNPTGGSTSYSYLQSPMYATGPSQQLSPGLPVDLDTVNAVAVDDGLGTISTTTYSYSNGTYYFNAPFDRKLAGFGKIVATDNAGSYTNSLYHTGAGTDSTHGEYQDSKSKIGDAYRVERYDASNNLVSKDITRWDQTSFGANRYFVFPQSTVSSLYGSGGTHRDMAKKDVYENTHGNVIQKLQYGEVTGSDDGTFTDTGIDLASTTISYAASTSPYIVALPSDELTQDQSSNKVRETRHYYDSLSLGNVNVGNETKTESWITGSTYASTTKAYDGTYGLVTQSHDADGNLTTNTLDTKNLYVATSTNALSQATGYQYDYSTSKVKGVFDANNRLNTTIYDGLGRSLTINIPDPGTGATVTKTSYTYTDSSTPGSTSILETDNLNSATSTAVYTYFDGLNRKLQSRKQFQSTNYVVNDWTYNNRGLTQSASLPYFSSGSARTSATTSSALFTNYSYDALQRVVTIANAVGSTTNAYNNWTVTANDPDGKIKDYSKDAYGNLTTVVEHIATTTATTTYAWDLNKNLTKITDTLANVRNFAYDGLNRRLTTEDLHAVSDGTFGTTTYAYDPVGNLTQKLDPKSQTVNYTYDALNRPITEDFTGSGGTEITYAYDACQDGKTRLCAATTSDAVINLTYNPDGLTASEQKAIDSVAYTTAYSYDRQGNITDLTYPDNSAVRYTYDNSGLASAVSRKATSTYAFALSQILYAPTGAISFKKFGNGVSSTYTYDPNQLYRLIHIVTAASSTIQQSGGSGGSLGLRADPFATFASAQVSHSPLAAGTVDQKSMVAPLAAVEEPLAKVHAGVLSLATLDSVGGAPSAPAAQVSVPTQIIVDGKTKTFANSDDNSGEDLIINSDQQIYSGLSQADVYFSVENTTKSAQHIDLSMYFPSSNDGVSNISRLQVAQVKTPTLSDTCTPFSIASTTPGLTGCAPAVTGSQTNYMLTNRSTALPTAAFDAAEIASKLGTGTHTRKSINQEVSDKTGQDVLQPGEKAFYKATIHFTPTSVGEFFIEAVGGSGGYGQLDPWFSSSWQYRKKVTISGVSGAGTNYQMLLKIGESGGSTSTKQFDLGGHSSIFPTEQNQGGDLQFTSSDGTTPLNFWVEDATGTAPNRIAYVWVKVGDDLGTNKDIYVYYGNGGASNASNGFNTFNFFDNFESGVIDPQKWTTICSTGCNITGGTSSSVSESGGVMRAFHIADVGDRRSAKGGRARHAPARHGQLTNAIGRCAGDRRQKVGKNAGHRRQIAGEVASGTYEGDDCRLALGDRVRITHEWYQGASAGSYFSTT